MSAVLNSSPPLAESLAAAARAVGGVLSGANLNAGLEAIRPRTLRAAAQDLSFNALRCFGLIDAAFDRLLERPLMDQAVRALLLAALAELLNRPQSAHIIKGRRRAWWPSRVPRGLSMRCCAISCAGGRSCVRRSRRPTPAVFCILNGGSTGSESPMAPGGKK